MFSVHLRSCSLPPTLCGLATLGLLSAFTIVVGQAQTQPPAASASAPAESAVAPASATSSASASTMPPAASGLRARGARGSAAPAAPVATIPRDALPFVPKDFTAVNPKLPTLVIAGDSTAQTGDNAHRGWGALLNDYFDTTKINLVNPSIGGRSFRSFYHEGHWAAVVAGLKPGDIVMIQFGHNDGGNATTSTNGRPDLPGAGDETQTAADAKGAPEVVHTLGWYLKTYIADVRAKGAIPVVMAATPYNRWANGVFRHQPGDLSAVQKQIADDEKVLYLNHTDIIGDRYDQLGQKVVQPLFGDAILHTTTAGAIVNAEAFIAGVKALEIKTLTDALNEKGRAIAVYKPAPAPPAAALAPATGSITAK